MRSLYHYIRPLAPDALKNNHITNPPILDGHCHIFSHRGLNPLYKNFEGVIGFADIEFDNLSKYKDIPGMYDKYINIKTEGWLATALCIEDIKKIHDKHPDKIVGFGELKLYNEFKGKEIHYKSIMLARQVAAFSQANGCKPIYIHYELTCPREISIIDRLLRDYPDVPIVLCHLGMNGANQEFAFNAARKLALDHGNCWLDISWDVAIYLSNNPMLISTLPVDRCFWGSDYSPRLQDAIDRGQQTYTIEQLEEAKSSIITYIDSDRNIKRLFNGKS